MIATRLGVKLILASVVGLWIYGWLPSLVTLFVAGRGRGDQGLVAAATSPQAESASRALTFLVIALLLGAVLVGIAGIRRVRPEAGLILVALWGVLVIAHGELSSAAMVFPLFVAAWFLIEPPADLIYRALAWLGVATAAMSVGMGLVTPLAFMSSAWSNADKGILGTQILAGPYGHSNALGLVLALTLPFTILHFRKSSWQWAAFGVMVVALIWSASRVSLGAAIVSILVCAVGFRASLRLARFLLMAAAGIAAALMVALPLWVSDPGFLTGRGRIWIISRNFDTGSPIGLGVDAFRDTNGLTWTLGHITTTGHNVFVTTLLAGGAVGIALGATWLLLAALRSRRAFPQDRVRLVFLVILLTVGIAEDPVRALLLGPQAFAIYPMLFILVGGARMARVSPATSTPTRSRALSLGR